MPKRKRPAKATSTIGDMLRGLEPGTLMVMTGEGKDIRTAGHRLAALNAIEARTEHHPEKERLDMIADLAGRLDDMDDFDVQVMLISDLDPHECGRA